MKSRCVCYSFALPITMFVMMMACVKKQAGWQGTMSQEQGIRVVQNPLTPADPGPLLRFQELYVLDEEDPDLVDLGLAQIRDYAVDSQGNAFLLAQQTLDNYVYKFDTQGKFLFAFVPKGEGPGEAQVTLRMRINARDELTLRDPSRRLLLVFDAKEGNLLEEVALSPDVRHIDRLPDGNYLISRHHVDLGRPSGSLLTVELCDARMNIIKELTSYILSDKDHSDGRIEGRIEAFYWLVNRGHIYIVTDLPGYEIRVYDLSGDLQQRIRKDSIPVRYPDTFKLSYRNAWKSFPHVRIEFPSFLPPCHALFADDRNRLFVQTFEPGSRPGTWIHDIFDDAGRFMGRQSLDIVWRGGSLGLYAHAIAAKDRLYFLREKDNGFREFVAYRMRWR
jgi:hypothetical protein